MSEQILSEIIKCWSCDRDLSLKERAENDGDCIFCGEEIYLTKPPYVKPNRFVYHYNAMAQESNGSMSYSDGIAQMERKITCIDDYKSLKKSIIDSQWESKSPDHLIINNLSFLGMGQD